MTNAPFRSVTVAYDFAATGCGDAAINETPALLTGSPVT
jgi:hypothetical protein